MVNQALIDYVKEQTRQGVPSDALKSALRTVGWGEADINEALGSVAAPPALAPNPSFTASSPEKIGAISPQSNSTSPAAVRTPVTTAPVTTPIRTTPVTIPTVTTIPSTAPVAIAPITKAPVTATPMRTAASAPVDSVFPPKKKKIIPLVPALVLLVVMGVGSAFGMRAILSSSTTPAVVAPPPAPVETTAPVPVVEAPKEISPKEAYLAMRAVFDQMKTYADLEAFVMKYGNKDQVAKLTANQDKINAIPVADRDKLVTATLAAFPTSKEITTIDESVNGDVATLTASSTKPGLTGTITLVREGGEWKLKLESWQKQ